MISYVGIVLLFTKVVSVLKLQDLYNFPSTTGRPDTDAVDHTESISGDDANRRHPTHQQTKRQGHHEDEVVYGDCVAQIVGGEIVDNLTTFCSSFLIIRTYVSHLQCKLSVVRPVTTGEIDIMIKNTSRLVACLTEMDVNHGILQHLEHARHTEVVAEHQNRHSCSVL